MAEWPMADAGDKGAMLSMPYTTPNDNEQRSLRPSAIGHSAIEQQTTNNEQRSLQPAFLNKFK